MQSENGEVPRGYVGFGMPFWAALELALRDGLTRGPDG